MVNLEVKLPDDFCRTVLSGSLRVVKDKENPIRMNLFAAGIRELFGHILHSFSPDMEVRACPWFVQANDTKTVTRRQRATYATQGGLSDDYLAKLEIDVGELHQEAIDAIEKLNGATHVRPDSIEQDQEEIEKFVASALFALDGLLESFHECRETVRQALETNVYDAMMNTMVTETIQNIDDLAGRGYEIDPFIDEEEFEIEEISSSEIRIKFTGNVSATLHYGDKRDSAEISHDFPFWMRFSAPVGNPTKLTCTNYHFDNSSWYE